MDDNMAVRTSCGRRDMMIAAMGKGDNIWVVNLCLTILVLTLVVVLSMALYTAAHPTDSQGVPCTISTAQNADGSRECGN